GFFAPVLSVLGAAFGTEGQPFFASSQWQRTFEKSPELSVLRAVVVSGHSRILVTTLVCSLVEPSVSLTTQVMAVLDVPSLTLSNVLWLPCLARSSTPALHASSGAAKCVSTPENLYVTLPSIHLSLAPAAAATATERAKTTATFLILRIR